MVIFLAIYILCIMTADEGGRLSRWPLEVRLALVLGAGVVMGLAIGPLRETLLNLIGDRRAAIAAAIEMARADDIICVAGKGHEQGQIVGRGDALRVIPFDDVSVAREVAA